MSERLLRVHGSKFCAGCVWRKDEAGRWHISRCAPILNWMRNIQPENIGKALARRGYAWEWVGKNASPGEKLAR